MTYNVFSGTLNPTHACLKKNGKFVEYNSSQGNVGELTKNQGSVAKKTLSEKICLLPSARLVLHQCISIDSCGPPCTICFKNFAGYWNVVKISVV